MEQAVILCLTSRNSKSKEISFRIIKVITAHNRGDLYTLAALFAEPDVMRLKPQLAANRKVRLVKASSEQTPEMAKQQPDGGQQ